VHFHVITGQEKVNEWASAHKYGARSIMPAGAGFIIPLSK
jgi:hypothetical protein